MRIKNQPPMRQGSSNDFQTPPFALEPLVPFLKKEWTIWECADGEGNLRDEFKRLGFACIGTDIELDFLKNNLINYDCIITNPPFSLKQQFLQRCYELGKPFALLLPLTTFETAKRQHLFKKYGLQVIFFDKRINFETPSGKGSGSWFTSAWFTWGLNLPKDLMFVKLKND
ncbi:hypothetical protein LCGC14_2814410 [marine sediment metagenome]|uniref:tRNA (Adenine-N(6)-)-methyltransferase n=1 Tax=marine sediment metagenome TaxID=412755 RepID=A0A0F9ASB5_9ZZZZ